jgi:hypothetical protein
MKAATSSWVDNGFAEQIETSAPNFFAVITKTHVSFVMCKQNPNRYPDSGKPLSFSFFILSNIDMCLKAQRYAACPSSASPILATLPVKDIPP